ncbi:iron-sulfur cluster assembly scaffold protein [Kiritimatiella glycovorans]|uniref:NifU-like protein n=1 Tax=Kiritimatiella glycovorans TaxID=1307763 RepID=A0A0G3ED94_9BACT|nr:iron-sulfur cluster assembly scaffold protein [Kiritimatiella glycovorans]AKJ63327.1 NifU-like protein [Kiritimatiella glycovorans]
MDWVYNDTVKDHFMNPRNVLMDEDGFGEDGRGLTGNVKCGDQMLMLIKVDPDEERITDCRWKTYGCASAIASTSILSEVVKGLTLDEAFNLTPKDITARLGGLPEHKIHCSVLGDKALRAAVNDYYQRTGRPEKVREDKAKLVCQCMAVTDHEIEDAVLEGVRDYQALQEHTKLGTVCGQCRGEAEKLMGACIGKHFDH